MDKLQELRKKYGPEYQKKVDFYRKVAAPAVVAAEKLGMDPKILMAQAALESNWAASDLATKANNLGGVKAKRDQPYVEMKSAEGYGPNRRVETSKFAKYPDMNAFFEEWPKIFQQPRYADAIKERDPNIYGRKIVKSGYSTEDPNTYAKSVSSIYKDIERMMLDQSIMDSKVATEQTR